MGSQLKDKKYFHQRIRATNKGSPKLKPREPLNQLHAMKSDVDL